jgi:hypothetical protein
VTTHRLDYAIKCNLAEAFTQLVAIVEHGVGSELYRCGPLMWMTGSDENFSGTSGPCSDYTHQADRACAQNSDLLPQLHPTTVYPAHAHGKRLNQCAGHLGHATRQSVDRVGRYGREFGASTTPSHAQQDFLGATIVIAGPALETLGTINLRLDGDDSSDLEINPVAERVNDAAYFMARE